MVNSRVSHKPPDSVAKVQNGESVNETAASREARYYPHGSLWYYYCVLGDFNCYCILVGIKV